MNRLLRYGLSRELVLMLLALILASLLSVGLIGIRVVKTWSFTYLFLLWNLFLAWLPLIFAIIMWQKDHLRKKRWIPFALLFSLWLLFYPNCAYILTDLFHLQHRAPVPLWYDLMVLMSAAINGMMLGFISLFLVQKSVSGAMGGAAGWAVALSTSFLGSFGIYLGRFLRWNSWDIISQPFGLFTDISNLLLHPVANFKLLLMITAMGCLLFVVYLILVAFINFSYRMKKEEGWA